MDSNRASKYVPLLFRLRMFRFIREKLKTEFGGGIQLKKSDVVTYGQFRRASVSISEIKLLSESMWSRDSIGGLVISK